MHSDPFFVTLRRLLEPAGCAQVISALRQDNLVWDALGDPALFAKCLQQNGSEPAAWSPASIALASFEESLLPDTLSALPLQPVSNDLRKSGAHFYEETLRKGTIPTTLTEAAYLALALRERRRLTGTWEGLPFELNIQNGQMQDKLSCIWKSALSICYGIIPDNAAFLDTLVSSNAIEVPVLIDLVSHIALTQPTEDESRAMILLPVISKYPQSTQVRWLEHLRPCGQDDLISSLARKLIGSNSTGMPAISSVSAGHYNTAGRPVEFSSKLSSLELQRHSAELYRLAGQPELALNILQHVGEGMRCVYSRILAETAAASQSIGDRQTAKTYLQKGLDTAPELEANRIDMAACLSTNGGFEEALTVLEEAPVGIEGYVTATRFASAVGDTSRARQAAIQALQEFDKPGITLADAEIIAAIPDFIDNLLALDMPEDALRIGKQALITHPADPKLYSAMSRANTACINLPLATETAQMALALRPTDLGLHRTLATAQEQAGDWEEAYQERKTILARGSSNSADDLLAVAVAASNSNRIDEAAEISSEILQKDPENGQAHAIQGQALRSRGDFIRAVEHLNKATYLAPELPAPWLALAEIYEEQGSQSRSLEILRAGSLASPESAGIHQALAESCLQNGLPSEALPALRKAVQLDPNCASTAIRLGDILRSLGRLDESANVLKRALRHSTGHAELGYELAKTSIAAGDAEEAIRSLEIKLASEPSDPEPYLLYARLLMDSNQQNPGTVESSCRLSQAEGSLQKVLARRPEDLEAGVLLADVLTAAGRTQEAMLEYQELAEKYADQSPAWSWRIKLGLGKAALDLDQIDLALAAMQEAARLNPGSLEIQKTLAETYFAANLVQEAVQAGSTAMNLASSDSTVLMWFAGLASVCGALNESVSALESAAEVSSESVEPWLRLAQVEILANNPPAARSALNSILHNTTADGQTMQKAAYLYLQAGDLESAEECLLKSTEMQGGVDAWFGLAKIQQETGQTQAALDTVRTAIAAHPGDPRLHIIEADLLSSLGQYDEGLASLTRMPAQNSANDIPKQAVQKTQCEFPPIEAPAFFMIRTDLPAVLSKSAALLRNMGDLQSALDKSLQALEIEPANLQVRKQAISIASAMLDHDTALSLAPEVSGNSVSVSAHNDPDQVADLLCARAEVEIELEQYDDAAHTLARAAQVSPSFPRILANQSFLAGVGGDFIEAEQLLEKAIRRLDEMPKENANHQLTGIISTGRNASEFDYPTLTIARSALQVYQWGLGLPLIDQALRSAPHEPAVHLAAARASVLAREAARICSALRVVSHKPAFEESGITNEDTFNTEIEIADRMSHSVLAEQWKTRGEAAFHPENLDTPAQDHLTRWKQAVASHLWGLKEANAVPSLLEQGKTMLDNPEAMLPYALALLPHLPEQSLTIAKKMAGLTSNHPLHQAALAIIAGEADDEVDGLQAIEQALQIWPDEPEWHVIAARLSAKCGDSANEIRHWEMAHQLAPECMEHMVSLGRAYLASRNYQKSLDILENATEAEESSAEAWLALAEANVAVSNFEKAFTCAEKAAILAPDRPEPRLISGKIALEAGQIPTARLHAEAVLLRDAGEPAAMLILAKSFSAEGRSKEALNYLEKATPLARDAFPLLYERVAVLKKLGSTEAAVNALQELSTAYPREVAVLKDLALLLAQTGNTLDAEVSAQAALRLQPYQPDLHLLAGSLQRETGQLDQAVYHLSEAIHQNPTLVEGYLELGKTYQERRETAMAMDVLNQAISVSPNDARPYFQAAMVLKESKDYVEAETMLRKAASLSPDDVAIRRQLGAIIALNLVHNPLEAVR